MKARSTSWASAVVRSYADRCAPVTREVASTACSSVSEFTASVLVWTTLRTWLSRASGDQFHAEVAQRAGRAGDGVANVAQPTTRVVRR